MALRSVRERLVQSATYEAGGLLLATPLYAALFGTGALHSFVLMLALSVVVMIWVPLHNAVFDRAEWRLACRVASDRPQLLRLVHALSLEISSAVVSVPILMILGGHGFWQAVAVDLGLSLLYAVYAYVFHLAWDRLSPVTPERAS